MKNSPLRYERKMVLHTEAERGWSFTSFKQDTDSHIVVSTNASPMLA